MTIKSMFFNAVQNGNTYDRVYSAEDFSGYLDKIVGDGVFASPSVNLQVIANNPANMAVYVHAGQGWIQGHKFISSEAIGIDVPAAHGTSARVDSVNFYLDYEEREMGVRIVTGTPGSSNPTALVQTNTFWEYRLAKITVGAGATSISQSNITDRRGTEECPFVAGLIDEIDAESLFAQWDDQFNDWLVGVQEQLSRMGSFVSGIRRLEAVYNTSTSSTVSSFNVTTYIPEYSSVTDCLELFINGLKLTTEEYTLSGTTVTLSEAIVQKRVPIDIVVWHVYAPGDDYIQEIRLAGIRVPVEAHRAYIPVDDTLTQERVPGEAKKTGEELAKKVDKVEGKGLSTNDFNNTYKTKLDGIEDGAEVNVIEEIKLDGVALTPDGNRAVNIPVDDTLEETGIPADSKAVGDAIADLEERKTNPDGYYEGMTVGNAIQLVGTQGVIDKDPYIFRKTGYPNDVGNRVYDEIVGGSIAWNQLVQNGNFETASDWTALGSASIAISSNKLTLTVGSGQYAGVASKRTDKKAIEGHKHLIIATFKSDTTLNNSCDFSIHTGNAQQTSSYFDLTANTKTTVSKIISINASVASGSSNIQYQLWIPHRNAVEGATIEVSNVMAVNLTAEVTPLIADYIYSLETAHTGDGVEWFKKYFPGVYYGYSEPTFQHVQTNAKETIGFNQWDEEWRSGYYDANTGDFNSYASQTANKNPIKVLPNTLYSATMNGTGGLRVVFRDADKNLVSIVYLPTTSTYRTFTTPSNCFYVDFCTMSAYGGTYKNDICINISSDRNGEYKPYKKRTYPLEALTLRGIPKLDSANRLYYDGDVYRYDGSGEYRFGLVDLGTLNYTYENVTSGGVTVPVFHSNEIADRMGGSINIMAEKYVLVGNTGARDWLVEKDKTIASWNRGTNKSIGIRDDSYTDVASFKSAMSGVYLLYEKATPEPFTAEPYQYPMVVDPLGTERFVDYAFEQGERDVEIPVGHTSDYPPNLRDKLQNLPSLSSDGDGRYIIVQTGNQMVLSPDTSAGLIAALEARVAALEGGN